MMIKKQYITLDISVRKNCSIFLSTYIIDHVLQWYQHR